MKKGFIIICALVIFFTLLIPIESVTAQEDKGVTTVPTLQAPRLTISLTNPTYKWTRVSSASLYQLQVYKGSSKVIDTNVLSSYCTTSLCKVTPSTTLEYATYKWRVRAQIGGSWKEWTAYTYFSISTAFNAQFNGNANGWYSNGGTWYVGSDYLFTYGSNDGSGANAYRYITTYTNFDFSARVKRTANTSSCGLGIRMGSNLGGSNYWYPGYAFYYNNSGTFSVWRRDGDGVGTAIFGWTSTTAGIPYDWNVLRVIAVGPTLHFFINGVYVASVVDANYSNGYVGFIFYSGYSSEEFQVDWARLNPLDASFQLTDTISPEQQALNDAANQAPSTRPESGE